MSTASTPIPPEVSVLTVANARPSVSTPSDSSRIRAVAGLVICAAANSSAVAISVAPVSGLSASRYWR